MGIWPILNELYGVMHPPIISVNFEYSVYTFFQCRLCYEDMNEICTNLALLQEILHCIQLVHIAHQVYLLLQVCCVSLLSQ